MDTELIYSVIASLVMLLLVFGGHGIILSHNLKKQLEKTQVQKNNYEAISRKANDIIITIDITNGKILDANIQAAKRLGYDNRELLQKTIHNLHPSELWDESAKIVADVWEQKGLVYQHLPFVKKSGEILQVECSAKVLIYDDKPVIVIYSRDITQRLILEHQLKAKSNELEAKNKNITDSINYASRIQDGVLGNRERLQKLFSDSFVFMQPHSIVSGDFYWFGQLGQYKVVVAADCTGHGVPGAFMTVLGHDFLEEIIRSQGIVMPDKILTELDKKITSRLNTDNEAMQINDGMDIAIISVDTYGNKVYFAGAKNPLCIVQGGKLHLIKASSYTIGGRISDKKFELHKLEANKDAMYYIYSDGFQDQFGGEKNRKFLSKNFRYLLTEIADFGAAEQLTILKNTFKTWKNTNEQTDDVLVIGLRL